MVEAVAAFFFGFLLAVLVEHVREVRRSNAAFEQRLRDLESR